MITKLYFIILGLCVNFLAAQQQEYPNYLSVEGNYRSYGRPDNIGHGFAVEYSLNTSLNWLGLGVNLSYFHDTFNEYTVYNPYNPSEKYSGHDTMNQFKISLFSQIYVLNKQKFVDIYFNAGFHISKYNQDYYLLSFGVDETNQTFYFDRQDVGKKDWELGYELGLNFRLNMERFFVTPNVNFFSAKDEGVVSTLNLKLGYTF